VSAINTCGWLGMITVKGVLEMDTIGGGAALRARLVTPASSTPEMDAVAVMSRLFLRASIFIVLSLRDARNLITLIRVDTYFAAWR
jgi:hypothetical protein